MGVTFAWMSGEVETRLWIGGEQVDGDGAPLAVENPFTEEDDRDRRRRVATSSSTPRSPRRARPRAGWERTPAGERGEMLHEVATRLREQHRRARRADDARGRQAAGREPRRGRLDRRRVRLLRRDRPRLRRPRDPADRVDAARARGQGAGRRGRLHRALELPAAAARLEARAGARGRQRARLQAVGADPALDAGARAAASTTCRPAS